MLEKTLSGRIRMCLKTTVLVAGNDPATREALGQMLLDAGYEVIAEAADGLEAVEKTYSLLPDVVLMDTDLEEVSGDEAAQLICQMCPTPIVMLTTRGSCEHGAGIETLLLKPPTPAALEEALSMAVERFGVCAKCF